MKEPMIKIDRAPESWIIGFIDLGILEVTEEGIKVKENRPNTPQEAKGLLKQHVYAIFMHFSISEMRSQVYVCDKCGCYCDAGELHAGICNDCREEEELLEIRREERRQMLKRNLVMREDGQLVCNWQSVMMLPASTIKTACFAIVLF